jgi:hypothetical protein
MRRKSIFVLHIRRIPLSWRPAQLNDDHMGCLDFTIST